MLKKGSEISLHFLLGLTRWWVNNPYTGHEKKRKFCNFMPQPAKSKKRKEIEKRKKKLIKLVWDTLLESTILKHHRKKLTSYNNFFSFVNLMSYILGLCSLINGINFSMLSLIILHARKLATFLCHNLSLFIVYWLLKQEEKKGLAIFALLRFFVLWSNWRAFVEVEGGKERCFQGRVWFGAG